MAKWFKFQTPIFTTEDRPVLLMYAQGGSRMREVHGAVAVKIIESLGMQPNNDKVYAKATIDAKGQLVVNKNTITRKEKF